MSGGKGGLAVYYLFIAGLASKSQKETLGETVNGKGWIGRDKFRYFFFESISNPPS